MSSSRTALAALPIAEFQYRQMVPMHSVPLSMIAEETIDESAKSAEEELHRTVAAERTAAITETEARLRQEYEQRFKREAVQIAQALEDFSKDRKDYFLRVEAEVVQLALAIAGKIIHREAQVDPLLIAAIVQIALGKLKEGASASLRVRPEELNRWQAHFSVKTLHTELALVGDEELLPGDCVLDTSLGSVNFSLDVQLKEVEKGFFDVLAQRPQL